MIKKEAYTIPMKNELHDLPPAYIEPQQFDTLRDEAIVYADKLKNAGVDVDLNVISGSYHGFDQCGSLSAYDDGKGQGCHSRRAFDCWRLGNEFILALYKNNKSVEK